MGIRRRIVAPMHPTDELGATAQAMIPLLRGASSLTSVLFLWAMLRALGPKERAMRAALVGWGAPTVVGALVITVGAWPRDAVLTVFPVVTALSVLLGAASLGWRPAREAMAALSDAETRYLLLFRAVFGMYIVGGASAGIFPASFAWTGGLGDMIVAWLAVASPTSLGSEGPRPMRLLVHGVGALDLLQVGYQVVTAVVPWLRGNDSPGPTAFLPWIGVPLMLVLNLHGLRLALLPPPPDEGPG